MRLLTLLAFLLAGSSALAQGGDDRVLWRFEFQTDFPGTEVAVGPDGTVYGSDNIHIYALHPDGGVKWIRDGIGGGTPFSFLADGSVIVGHADTVYALDPASGADRWTFSYDSNGFREQIEVGPNVGPDGNIYAVTATDGQFGYGALALSPTGDLLWSDRGRPMLNPINAGTGGPVYFTDDRIVFPFNIVGSGASLVYAFSLDGDQTLYVDFTCTGVPRPDPLGRVIIASQCGVEAVATDGEEVFWRAEVGPIPVPPVIAEDGTIYTGPWLGPITAITPDGDIAWESPDADLANRMLAVLESRGEVVYGGNDFGVPDVIRSVSTDDGRLLWSFDLGVFDGRNELVWSSHGAESADENTVYFSTIMAGGGRPGAIYAVRVGDPCPADFNADGAVNTLDVLAFLNAWSTDDPRADFNGDGEIDTLDVLAFLNAWGAGC